MANAIERAGYIDRVAAWFGIGELGFRLSRTERKRLFYASIFPGLAVLFWAVRLFIEVFDLAYDQEFFTARSPWWQIDAFLIWFETVVLYMSVALLFVFSIYPVTRQLGAWAFVIVAVQLNLALGLALFSALPLLVDSREAYYTGSAWYSDHWNNLAYVLAILAVGYAFLAYRGLGRRELPRRRRVRVPPSQPREL